MHRHDRMGAVRLHTPDLLGKILARHVLRVGRGESSEQVLSIDEVRAEQSGSSSSMHHGVSGGQLEHFDGGW